MHSTSARIQNTFGFFTTVAFVVGLLTAVSVVFYPSNPTASVTIKNVKVVRGRAQHYAARTQEYAFVDFSLDADLTSLFNWNTKQVFAYLSITYPGPRNKHSENEAIIWDSIITSPKAAHVHVNNEKAKYQINDISGRWAERNATVRFQWNVQPHVGALTWGSIEAGDVEVEEKSEKWKFQFPSVGTSRKA